MATVMDWVGHDQMEMVIYCFRLRDEAARTAMKRFDTGAGEAPVGARSKQSPRIAPAPKPARACGGTTGNPLEHWGSETQKPRFQRGNGG